MSEPTDTNPIYLCDLHADASGFRSLSVIALSKWWVACAHCGRPATHICDANTPPNEVCDD